MKICIDCIHYRSGIDFAKGHFCVRDATIDIVTGKMTDNILDCKEERAESGGCKPYGKFYVEDKLI